MSIDTEFIMSTLSAITFRPYSFRVRVNTKGRMYRNEIESFIEKRHRSIVSLYSCAIEAEGHRAGLRPIVGIHLTSCCHGTAYLSLRLAATRLRRRSLFIETMNG